MMSKFWRTWCSLTCASSDLTDLNAWLPAARLRPHVVLKLLLHLLQKRHPIFGKEPDVEQISKQLARMVEARYPEQEGHLPEAERQGQIPGAVEAAIRRAMRAPPKPGASGLPNKNATPPGAPLPQRSQEASGSRGERAETPPRAVQLDLICPEHLFADRDSTRIEEKNAKDAAALGQHYRLRVETGKTLVDQWHPSYVSAAFPFSVSAPVSGAMAPAGGCRCLGSQRVRAVPRGARGGLCAQRLDLGSGNAEFDGRAVRERSGLSPPGGQVEAVGSACGRAGRSGRLPVQEAGARLLVRWGEASEDPA